MLVKAINTGRLGLLGIGASKRICTFYITAKVKRNVLFCNISLSISAASLLLPRTDKTAQFLSVSNFDHNTSPKYYSLNTQKLLFRSFRPFGIFLASLASATPMSVIMALQKNRSLGDQNAQNVVSHIHGNQTLFSLEINYPLNQKKRRHQVKN